MTNKEAKAYLQLATRVKQEFGCAVMFIADEEGRDLLAKAQKKFTANTDDGN